MKKLESIRGSKFELTKSEMDSTLGGEYSYEYFNTQVGRHDETKTDVKAWDICMPMP